MKNMALNKKSPILKIGLIFVLLIWIPTVSYTIFQISRIDKTETMIREIYDHQLNGIIFSINQYSWDVASNWAKNIRTIYLQYIDDSDGLKRAFKEFVSKNRAISGAFLFDEQNNRVIESDVADSLISEPGIKQLIETNSGEIDQLFEEFVRGYDRIVPFLSAQDIGHPDFTLLIFAIYLPGIDETERVIGAIFVNTAFAGREIVGRKLDEIETEDFMFGLKNKVSDELLYTTTPNVNWETFERQGSLWLFPELNILIRLRGTTTEQIAQTRTRINVMSLIAMNIALIGGILMVLRSVYREMQLSKMKSDFVSNVSHELRTPLSLIRMFAETLELKRVPSEEKKMQYYRIISNESNRLTRMINNILDFSRIEAGRKEFHLQKTNLTDIVHDILNSYRFHLNQKGFELQEEIDENLPSILADPEAVSQAFINILENAVKYSTEIKSIIVRLNPVNDQVVLQVEDKGIGIEKTYQQKIFDKFYRVGDSLVHNTKGSGLGLTLVKFIMDYHHGNVTVQSKPGEGSTFSLIFPIKNVE